MTAGVYYDDDFVRENFTLKRALESQRAAFRALGSGTAVLAHRVTMEGADGSVAFSYLARLASNGDAVNKLGSVNPLNAVRGEPAVSATVYVLDARTGRPAATLEATELTTLRTAAASALAVEQMARADAATLGIIGAGVQARAHAMAISRVRDLNEILVAARSAEQAALVVEELSPLLDVRLRAASAEEAAGADILATCTTSCDPVVETHWINPGAMVVSVGAFAPDRNELPVSLLDRAERVVVDHVPTASEQSGSVLQWAAQDPVANKGALVGLGEVLTGGSQGRVTADGIIVYLSVGLGIQDAAAAVELLRGGRGDQAHREGGGSVG